MPKITTGAPEVGRAPGRKEHRLLDIVTRGGGCSDRLKGRFTDRFRQEPVLYIAGRPHVLRIVDRPLENVE